ncbi:DUF2812 domain-containing protein [uncultured Corynebacterium sp.]|jgi:hypothetical protein|uniref:DUF2812 domain-containing protein n=1 Tax=uncultured Corynebacterium sp. TaxID=159447 RepID=UPI00259592EF|nr:DUF2812 domain-containing protein [uncultured Corynebacterium sp.]
MTTRFSGGLAFDQDRETELFQDMARKGKHLDGIALMGHGWSFRDGPAGDWAYEIAYEADPDPEFFDLCRGAGWEHVLSRGTFHVFRAAPGTTPLRTEGTDRIAEVKRQRDSFIRYSIVTAIVFLAVCVLLKLVEWNEGVETACCIIALIPVIYTWMPLAGFQWRLHRMRAE